MIIVILIMDVNILELNVMIMMNVLPIIVVLPPDALMMKFLVMILMHVQQIFATPNLAVLILPLIVKTTICVRKNIVAQKLDVFMRQ
jgi:hypothetical protein